MTANTLEDAKRRRRNYERVMAIIRGQTGPKQPPAAREHVIVKLATKYGFWQDTETAMPPADVRTALRAATERDDLIKHDTKYVLRTEDGLLEAIQAEANNADPDRAFVAKCSKALRRTRQQQNGGAVA